MKPILMKLGIVAFVGHSPPGWQREPKLCGRILSNRASVGRVEFDGPIIGRKFNQALRHQSSTSLLASDICLNDFEEDVSTVLRTLRPSRYDPLVPGTRTHNCNATSS